MVQDEISFKEKVNTQWMSDRVNTIARLGLDKLNFYVIIKIEYYNSICILMV